MNIIIFGAPGSGKGTQAEMLSKHYGLVKISLGDILREEVKKNSSLGNQVKSYMEKGELVPDNVVFEVIEKNIIDNNFILDGYPRNISQARMLTDRFNKKNIDLDAFVYLDVDASTVIKRLSARRICRKCGANYHLENMPPQRDNLCDVCGDELVQRDDDKPEVIEKRWAVFTKESKVLCDYYKELGKLVVIDGGNDKDTVFKDIVSTLDNG